MFFSDHAETVDAFAIIHLLLNVQKWPTAQQKSSYQAAKTANPARWKGRKTRNWEHENEVWLNPEKESTTKQRL